MFVALYDILCAEAPRPARSVRALAGHLNKDCADNAAEQDELPGWYHQKKTYNDRQQIRYGPNAQQKAALQLAGTKINIARFHNSSPSMVIVFLQWLLSKANHALAIREAPWNMIEVTAFPTPPVPDEYPNLSSNRGTPNMVMNGIRAVIRLPW